ncbi:pyridoxamine 5'-phosphate oxidase family protein [Candidatus Bipolaricaulota bacterium]|nr:pyridoxamine 5'-phosphate oxidase family protein [Candidatus Bipolaricaulota bacterium]
MPVKDVLDEFWRKRSGPVVLATVSASGLPNAAYCEAVNVFREDKIVIADNGFECTRRNILAGSKGCILFSTEDGRSYQVKGPMEYQTEGPIYDDMMRWLYPRFAGKAAIALTIEEIDRGSEKLYG